MSVDMKTASYSGKDFSDKKVVVSFEDTGESLNSVGAALNAFYASFGDDTDNKVKNLGGYARSVSFDAGTSEASADLSGEMMDGSDNKATVTLTTTFVRGSVLICPDLT